MRNIHISAQKSSQPAPAMDAMRVRKVTVSPAREYLMREGETAPISDALAAMILSKTGKCACSLKGVTINRKEIGTRTYWHPDSPLCNDLSRGPREYIYVVNPLAPEVLHLLDKSGAYVGSLPQQSKVEVFDSAAAADQLAGKKRQIARLGEHMARVHRPDTESALAAADRNVAEMSRIVQALPAKETVTGKARETAMPGQVFAAARDILSARAARAEAMRAAAMEFDAAPATSRATTPGEIPSRGMAQAAPRQIEPSAPRPRHVPQPVLDDDDYNPFD